MSRCVSLLLQVLRNTNDHKTLLDLCLQLRRTPDADKYVFPVISDSRTAVQNLKFGVVVDCDHIITN